MFVLIAISFKSVIPRKYPNIFPLVFCKFYDTEKRNEVKVHG